jgi:hypothetical protein
MPFRTRTTSFAALTATLLSAGAAAPLVAQSFPGFGGIEVRGGFVTPENTKTGFAAAVDADLGFLGSPSLRTLIGINYWGADVDRTGLTGSVSAMGGRGGLRLELLPAARLAPYLQATVHAHNVNADITDPALEDAWKGFNVGGGLGAGLSWALDDAQRTRLVAEVDRVFINNFNHWAFTAGLRFTPRGRDAYTPPLAVARDPRDRADRRAATAEAERLRAALERLG